MNAIKEAFQSFLFVDGKTTQSGAHFRDAIDLKRGISFVIIALVPCLLFGMYNVGYQHYHSFTPTLSFGANFWQNFWWGFLKVLPILVVTYVVGLGIEFASAQINQHPVNEGYLATGMLIALVIPASTPLWQVALAVAFAVIFGKEVFGGTGMNFMNPALLARAFLFFGFPASMSGDKVWIADKCDAFSGATSLAQMSQGAIRPDSSFMDMFLGITPGCIGETSTLLILIGGAFLFITGIASLRIMFSVFVGGAFMALLGNLFGSSAYSQLPFYYHFVMGGFAFGAIFMATDPVTACQTNNGKWIYGFLIGAFAVLIRIANPAYPEGMMLSILLMNVFAPLIDWCIVQLNINRREKRWKEAKNEIL